ncbi:MAG: hypothetical protein MUE42_00825 [Opitutaceae bacterium]|nr:hypothetical protein [Opitutaceae bacterium]
MRAFLWSVACAVSSGLAQTVSPTLVGTNLWYQMDGAKAGALRPALAEVGFGLIRIGGNGYNKTWPGDAKVATWCDYVRGLGAEPLVQVSALATPEQVAATVRALNRREGRVPVRRWSIGNEPDLDKWPVKRVRDYVLRLAEAMKHEDPTIQIYAPDLAGPHFDYIDPLVGGDLDITGAKLGDVFLIDGITWHRYAFWKDFTREEAVDRVEAAYHAPIRRLRARLAEADAKHGRAGENALKWGLGEFNLHVVVKPASNPALYQAVDGAGVNSFLNGQFFAEVYGVCMAERAEFAASWSIHESNGDRGTTDFGLFDGPWAEARPRASLHHSALVAKYFKGEYKTVAHALPEFAAFATRNGEFTAVMLLNKSQRKSRSLTLAFDGRQPTGSGTVSLASEAGASLEARGAVARTELPAQSTRVLVFDAKGGVVRQIDYTLDDAKAGRAPKEQVFAP